ncbi:MAG: hypothetical protein N2506_01255 [Dehalococcoidales bacterium]|nr:hypothetical protein [Dehalococcoidales bacterium]
MDRRFHAIRLFLAVVTTLLEELGIWALFRWVLPQFGVRLSLSWIVAIMAIWAVFCTWLFVFTTRVLMKQSPLGLPSMVGMAGIVVSRLAPEGMVRVKGELWQATSDDGVIEAGEAVEVTGEHGLRLTVRRRRPETTKR